MIKSKKLSNFKDITHAFFNKLGGTSGGIYKSLNCGPGSSDNKKKIFKNLEIVRRKIEPNSKKIILLNQLHSNKFYFIDKNYKIGNKIFKGDALITNKLNTPIGILTADCAPILIFDSKKKNDSCCTCRLERCLQRNYKKSSKIYDQKRLFY